jgi:acyl dehydratase
MIEVRTTAELAAHVGKPMLSDWLPIDQARIDAFSDATGDHQWIHVDPERAARELPGGRTIAHGFLTLSLLPVLSTTAWRVAQRSRGINYGSNKVRFINPVPSGSRIRLRATLQSIEPVEGGHRLVFDNTIEIEGAEKPALVSEVITLIFD